jgi:hypothetical protein
MPTTPLQWTDRAGMPHRLHLAGDLFPDEWTLLTILRQQIEINVLLLNAGIDTPTIRQAAPQMLRTMLRIVLPTVDDAALAAFDSTEGMALLAQWWANTDPST